MRITFWGVRGSIPSPGQETVGFGGNTSCVEVRAGNALFIFDGGTGLRLLGRKLAREMPLTAHIFFSHVHWDHIQGFPFFAPAFVPGNTIHLYGGNNVSRTLEETLAGQMDHPNFPVHLSDMGATMTFNDLQEGEVRDIDAGDGTTVRISTTRGKHPNGVWIYRVDHAGKSFVYATDTEQNGKIDKNIAALAKGADLIAHDAQYTPEEYQGTAGTGGPKVGWGHSTYVEAAKLAEAAGIKRLVLFHHDPSQTDDQVRAKESLAQAIFANSICAYEGLSIDL